jgi:hypothetical protein
MLSRVIFLMMETELISETSFDLSNLKRLSTREDFIEITPLFG